MEVMETASHSQKDTDIKVEDLYNFQYDLLIILKKIPHLQLLTILFHQMLRAVCIHKTF